MFDLIANGLQFPNACKIRSEKKQFCDSLVLI